MYRTTARIISWIFHPVIIPTLGFILLFHAGFYFSFLSWETRRFVLLIVFFTTAILPLLAIALLASQPGNKLIADPGSRRSVPFIFSILFYYLGYMLLRRIDAYSVFQIFILAAISVQIVLLMISLKWDVSSHMAALGSLLGVLLALAFRTGTNPVWAIVLVLLTSGIVGWSRLYLNRNKPWQLTAGYATGFIVLYLVIYLI
ncbi:MAG: hypothetical protein PHS40_03130 [Mariniphaga sp.]|nr:hypothetical protein [Mariniphaga sp.]MDD4424898.1 hypothetical protein [Mariniphaga sp.]